MTASRPGRPRTYASVEDAYHAHALPIADGHVQWAGPTVSIHHTPVVYLGKTAESAYRVGFRLHHGRDPEGVVRVTCGTARCVAGAHLADSAMRQRKTKPRGTGNQAVPREDIIALLAEGHPDRYIVRTLHTSYKRVRETRTALGLPPAARTALPIEQKWQAYARPLGGGHVEWRGPRSRYGTPVLRHLTAHLPAAAVAFRQQHSREPVGYVKAGCGMPHCVAPAHVEDRPMREALRTQYAAIFGA